MRNSGYFLSAEQKKKSRRGAARSLVEIHFIPAFFHEIHPKLGCDPSTCGTLISLLKAYKTLTVEELKRCDPTDPGRVRFPVFPEKIREFIRHEIEKELNPSGLSARIAFNCY